MYEDHMIHAVEYVPATVRRKRRNSKFDNNSIKNYPLIGLEKAWKKHEAVIKNVIKNEGRNEEKSTPNRCVKRDEK